MNKNIVETDSFTITDTIIGGSLITNVSSYIYHGSVDEGYLYLSGSVAINKNTYITPTISGLVGGNTYLYVARVTVDGEIISRKFKIVVQKESDLQ